MNMYRNNGPGAKLFNRETIMGCRRTEWRSVIPDLANIRKTSKRYVFYSRLKGMRNAVSHEVLCP
jgi:hypothetical protein